MFTLLVILILLVCLALTLIILAQSSKGDGLAGALGAPGSVGAVFGVRRASDFLQKGTIYLGAAFVVLCMLANMFFLPTSSKAPNAVQTGNAVIPKAQQAPQQQQSAPAVPQQPAGGQPGTGQTNPDNSPMPGK